MTACFRRLHRAALQGLHPVGPSQNPPAEIAVSLRIHSRHLTTSQQALKSGGIRHTEGRGLLHDGIHALALSELCSCAQGPSGVTPLQPSLPVLPRTQPVVGRWGA